ncbi:MAG: hypothetical protein ACRDF8_06630 [Chloroflexota bacterium]
MPALRRNSHRVWQVAAGARSMTDLRVVELPGRIQSDDEEVDRILAWLAYKRKAGQLSKLVVAVLNQNNDYVTQSSDTLRTSEFAFLVGALQCQLMGWYRHEPPAKLPEPPAA